MAQLVVKMLKRREALRQEAHTTLVGDKTIIILKMKRMNRIVDMDVHFGAHSLFKVEVREVALQLRDLQLAVFTKTHFKSKYDHKHHV